jgi:hypothetical protein
MCTDESLFFNAQVSLPVVYTAFAAVALVTVAFSEKYIVETQGKSLEEIERMLSSAH